MASSRFGAALAAGLTVCLSAAAAAQQPRLEVALPVRAGHTQIKVFLTPPGADPGRLVAEVQQKAGDANQIVAREVMAPLDGASGQHAATFRIPLVAQQTIRVSNADGSLQATAVVGPAGPVVPVLFGPIRVGATTVRGRVARGIPDGGSVVVHVLRQLSADVQPVVVDEIQLKKTDDQGGFATTLSSPLLAGDAVIARTFVGNESSEPARLEVYDTGDWGRTRAYFAGGVVMSKRRETATADDDFSKQDLSLAFVLDKSWLQRQLEPLPGEPRTGNDGRRRSKLARALMSARHFNTFFDTRVTALPVKVEQSSSSSGGSGGGSGGGGSQTPVTPTRGVSEFVASKKGAVVQIGAYVPFYGGDTSWRHNGAINSLFVAPVGRFGIQTITGDRVTAEEVVAGRDDVFTFWSWGFGLGHYRVPNNRNVAPELISYLHITRGKSEAYDRFPDPNNREVYVRGWRYFVEGRLKVPDTPLQIGFDANMGEAEDDIRFVFGTRFDIGELFAKLRAF